MFFPFSLYNSVIFCAEPYDVSKSFNSIFKKIFLAKKLSLKKVKRTPQHNNNYRIGNIVINDHHYCQKVKSKCQVSNT